MLTVPVRTVCTATWKGRTIMMTWCIFIGWFLTSPVLTRVRIVGKWDEDTWPNLEAPRVTHYLAIGFI